MFLEPCCVAMLLLQSHAQALLQQKIAEAEKRDKEDTPLHVHAA